MSDAWSETLNGFKTYVEKLQADKEADVEYIFSLTTFDTQIDTPYIGVPIASVDGGKLKDFGPRGGTALYDAVGKTLQAHDEDKTLSFESAIVVIVTDGQENQSREWSKSALHAAIDERISDELALAGSAIPTPHIILYLNEFCRLLIDEESGLTSSYRFLGGKRKGKSICTYCVALVTVSTSPGKVHRSSANPSKP